MSCCNLVADNVSRFARCSSHSLITAVTRSGVSTRLTKRSRINRSICSIGRFGVAHTPGLTFADPDQSAKATRDPVAPAKRSKAALAKVARHTLDDATPAHSFAPLMAELATIARNTCRTPHAAPDGPTFEVLTTPNAKQEQAFELLRQIRM